MERILSRAFRVWVAALVAVALVVAFGEGVLVEAHAADTAASLERAGLPGQEGPGNGNGNNGDGNGNNGNGNGNNGDGNGNNGNGNGNNGNGNGNNGDGNGNNGNNGNNAGGNVDSESDSVTICHLTGSGLYQDLEVNENALGAHQGHGDVIPAPAGGCANLNNEVEAANEEERRQRDANAANGNGAVSNGNGAVSASAAGKITICHATSSETNPFVEITVSENSVFEKDSTTDLKDSGHGAHVEDIIPVPEGGCPGPEAVLGVTTGVDDDDQDVTPAADVDVHVDTVMADAVMRITVALTGAGLDVVQTGHTVTLPGLDVPGIVVLINGRETFLFPFDSVLGAQFGLDGFTPPSDVAVFQSGPTLVVVPDVAQQPLLEDQLTTVLGASVFGPAPTLGQAAPAAAAPALAPQQQLGAAPMAPVVAGEQVAPAPASTGSGGLLAGSEGRAMAVGLLLALGATALVGGRVLAGRRGR